MAWTLDAISKESKLIPHISVDALRITDVKLRLVLISEVELDLVELK